MYDEIYVPFDNSDHAFGALELAASLAAMDGATVVGSHVYAARLHDWRFRALESGLPEQYRAEPELERQRGIHDSLITNGLELITDAYLEVMARHCREAGAPFRGVSLEGRNWEALAKDIPARRPDMVVMGAMGLGRTADSLLGTVCERVVRRVNADVLCVRTLTQPAPHAPIVACVDGSPQAWGGLEHGLHLAARTGRPLMAVAAFDPYFHYTVFSALKSALNSRARQVFRFEQQEQLHEQIIDSGLAKIYQSHLDVARKFAEQRGVHVETRLLDGKPTHAVLGLLRELRPWLAIVGRCGVHGGEALDLGGLTEHLLRQAPCNVLVSARTARPPDELVAEETTAWSEEGAARLDKAPAHVRGVARAAIQRYAVAHGHTVITSRIVDEALQQLLPPHARSAMGIPEPAAPAPAPDRVPLSYGCPSCQYIHGGSRPAQCPVCGAEGSAFRVVPGRTLAAEDGTTVTQGAFDGVALQWAPQALRRLETVGDAFLRERARHKVEKQARTRGLQVIGTPLVEEALRSEGLLPEVTAPEPTSGGEAAVAQGAGIPDDEPDKGPAAGWSPAAWQRLLRAPPGFMREQARACIEACARERGVGLIDLDVAEAGMASARERMIRELDADQEPESHGPAPCTPDEVWR